MTQETSLTCDLALHQWRAPVILLEPLHNSIPQELLSLLDPAYVEHYYRNNAGRLHTNKVPIEESIPQAPSEIYHLVQARKRYRHLLHLRAKMSSTRLESSSLRQRRMHKASRRKERPM